MRNGIVLTNEPQFVAIWWKGCMSIKKGSPEQFTRFFNRLCSIGLDFELTDEVLEGSSNESTGSPAIVALSSQDLHSSSGVRTKGLERYYAVPGKAEWGC